MRTGFTAIFWILEQITEGTGVRKDLFGTFGGNTEMEDIVMTLAIYMLCGKGTYGRLSSWQRIVEAPYDQSLRPVHHESHPVEHHP